MLGTFLEGKTKILTLHLWLETTDYKSYSNTVLFFLKEANENKF